MTRRRKNAFRIDLAEPAGAVQEHLARIDLLSESIRVTIHRPGRTRTMELSPAALARLFGRERVRSGFLPPRTLHWGRSETGEEIVIAVPAGRVQAVIETGGGAHNWDIPHPPLIFAGAGARYWLFAVRSKNVGPDSALYRAPFPNVHSAGPICLGSVNFPAASARTIEEALQRFMQSRFNEHLVDGKSSRYPESVLRLWETLRGTARYPVNDLVPMETTLGEIFGVGAVRRDPRRGGAVDPVHNEHVG